MPLDLPFPFTLPRLFRNPAISNFFPFPLGLRNSEVRLYLYFQVGSLVGRALRSTQDQASVFGHRLKAEFLSCKSVNYTLGKLSGAPNDGFLLNALKTPFRLSRELLDLYKCILSSAKKFRSVRLS